MFRRKNPETGADPAMPPDSGNNVPAERLLFDARTYLDKYPDIAAAGVDPFEHFMGTGWAELRRPSALFEIDWYASQFPAGEVAGINPLLHYVTTGARTGCSPTPLFDGKAYCALKEREPGPDFVPLAAFLSSAPDMDFDPCPLFDTKWFFRTYPEVAELDENYLLFFARAGSRSGYDPSPHFSCAWYLDQYPDVAASDWNPLAHYLAIGQYEGRSPLPVAPDEERAPPGAYEIYGEYSASHSGEAVVIADEPRTSPKWAGRLAVHVHIFYDDLMETLYAYLDNLTVPFSLFISVPDTDLAGRAKRHFSRLTMPQEVIVEVVPNRGRDLSPLLAGFSGALEKFDLLMHVHSKKSAHTDEKRDWLLQMLHHLMVSGNHFDQILGMFRDTPALGIVFPVYHPSVRGQIEWGGNRQTAAQLLERMGLQGAPGPCPIFPAGSCFVVRTSMLKPLWDLGLSYSDFEDEDGAIDGGLAHVVERLLGVLPVQAGQRACQVRAGEPHMLSRSWMRGRTYQSALLQKIDSGELHAVPSLGIGEKPDLKVVVYSCATAGYDHPLPHECAIHGAEYCFYTDSEEDPSGLWKIEPLQMQGRDPVQTARLHKMSPHILFPDADIAIWIDANVAITGDITVYVRKLLEEDVAFGLVRHPIRNSFVEEARALNDLGIDRPAVLGPQIGGYLLEGVPSDLGLTETNFMLMDLRKPETIRALEIWREEISDKSVRDQVSFDYARWKSGANSVWLFDDGGSVRSNPRFAYFEHGAAGHRQKDVFRGRAYTSQLSDSYNDLTVVEARHRAQGRSVDVIVTIHDAFEGVKACLDALETHRDALTRLILVDDGSAASTAELVRRHADARDCDRLIRHEKAMCYTRAANVGLQASSADVVVLLNSDTIVTAGSIRKLVAAIERNTDAGLSGPLSNAATWQSVPEQTGPDGEYVTNELPKNWSLPEIAAACERISSDPHIFVPALNGFCMAISRRVLDAIGFLDESAFPQGYGEETDYCFRAAEKGFCSVIATDSYVFHSKSRSFGHQRRRLLSEAGYRTLIERYGSDRLDCALWALRNTSRLQQARKAFRDLVV